VATAAYAHSPRRMRRAARRRAAVAEAALGGGGGGAGGGGADGMSTAHGYTVSVPAGQSDGPSRIS
jgi:hypothetical protein